MILAAAVLFALTRAEIVERFKSPVITQADGLVQVFAECPEDMRREFQSPVARFAADTVRTLYRGLGRPPQRFARPGIVIRLGDVRTNATDVVTGVATNGARVVTRIRLPAPGFADLYRFKVEVVKGFYRSVVRRELGDDEAVRVYRLADPALRVAEQRAMLEDWLAGRGTTNDEEGIRMLRTVFEPGRSSRRDVLTFASRLYLYPPQHAIAFLGKYDILSFREAVRLARADVLVRAVALLKANDLPVFGCGRSPELAAAAEQYGRFLREFAAGEASEGQLNALLDEAEAKLNVAFEQAEE